MCTAETTTTRKTTFNEESRVDVWYNRDSLTFHRLFYYYFHFTFLTGKCFWKRKQQKTNTLYTVLINLVNTKEKKRRRRTATTKLSEFFVFLIC